MPVPIELPPVAACQINNSTMGVIPRLGRCSLRGIHTSESDLVHFLSAIRPSTVVLADVSLTPGLYSLVFQYLTSQDNPVTSYHHDDIYEGTNLVHFEVPKPSKFRSSRVTMRSSTLSREGNHAKGEITYCVSPRRALESRERYRWKRSKAQEFGDPGGSSYDLL